MQIVIVRGDFQDLTYSHACTGHEFQHETVSVISGPEDHFINQVLFQDFPGFRFWMFKELFQDLAVTWIMKVWIDGVSY